MEPKDKSSICKAKIIFETSIIVFHVNVPAGCMQWKIKHSNGMIKVNPISYYIVWESCIPLFFDSSNAKFILFIWNKASFFQERFFALNKLYKTFFLVNTRDLR